METLKLKHLAPYLPYELKIIHLPTKEQDKLTSLCHILGIGTNIDNYDFIDIDKVKPILRPLSDLKKIENIFSLQEVVTDELCFKHDTLCFEFQKPVKALNVLCDPLEAIEYLYRNHYDIFGLIEKGLAIDINTI